MYAKVEVTQEILDFIEKTKKRNETFDEIKEIAFSEEMKKKQFSSLEIFNYIMMFHKIKLSAYNKVINKKDLNLTEGLIFERLLLKYNNEELPSFKDYMKYINNNCVKKGNKNMNFKNLLLKSFKGEN